MVSAVLGLPWALLWLLLLLFFFLSLLLVFITFYVSVVSASSQVLQAHEFLLHFRGKLALLLRGLLLIVAFEFVNIHVFQDGDILSFPSLVQFVELLDLHALGEEVLLETESHVVVERVQAGVDELVMDGLNGLEVLPLELVDVAGEHRREGVHVLPVSALHRLHLLLVLLPLLLLLLFNQTLPFFLLTELLVELLLFQRMI